MWPTLQRRAHFDLVYEQGRKRTSPILVVFHVATEAEPRVAFVASRKVGGAVQRNRAKRVMRAAFRSLVPRLEPAWIVLVARAEILRCKSTSVAAVLEDLLRERLRPEAALQPDGGSP